MSDLPRFIFVFHAIPEQRIEVKNKNIEEAQRMAEAVWRASNPPVMKTAELNLEDTQIFLKELG